MLEATRVLNECMKNEVLKSQSDVSWNTHTNRSWWSSTGDRSAGHVQLAAVVINKETGKDNSNYENQDNTPGAIK